MKKVLKSLLYFLGFLLLLSIATITLIDHKMPKEQAYYAAVMDKLDSLSANLVVVRKQPFEVGFAKVSITPDSAMALAGYGNRKPKEFDAVFDSVFIRSVVIRTPSRKVAILSADLLIIHPQITRLFHQRLAQIGWLKNDVYLTATHSHSSIGQWAPGLVGGLFAGEHDERVAKVLSDRMVASVQNAEQNLVSGSLGYSYSENPDLVLNRLVGDRGEEDPFQKNLIFKTDVGSIAFTTFSAHATCLTSQSHKLSGDFPSYFHEHLEKDTSINFSIYAAGAVASMGPETPGSNQFERTKFLGRSVANRIVQPQVFQDSLAITSIRFPIALGKPQFKVSKNLVLRPYLFNYAFGNESSEISALLLGNTLLIGTPCDFSGELALPLYEFAKERGLDLIITSFNGGYIGYVTKDEWFDLEKYETRTMNWYGPGNGQYFSEIIEKLILAIDENN